MFGKIAENTENSDQIKDYRAKSPFLLRYCVKMLSIFYESNKCCSRNEKKKPHLSYSYEINMYRFTMTFFWAIACSRNRFMRSKNNKFRSRRTKQYYPYTIVNLPYRTIIGGYQKKKRKKIVP